MSKEKNQEKDDEVRYRMFKCFKRKFKISEAEPPADVREAFMSYSNNRTNMPADSFHRFLVECQEEKDISLADAERIMDQVLQGRPESNNPAGHGMNLDDLFRFLLSDDLNGPILSRVHHDMTAPMSHYFIYTGHNSYLKGNQLSSDCSDVPIIKALQRGVRVIELDVWPNSSKDDISVLHGRTLTSPVSLIKCLKSIEEHAFDCSPYPVIITLEDHLTPDLQAKAAKMITETFGEMLYYPESEGLTEFPSPESLKHRIIISTKPPKEYLEESKNGKKKEKHLSRKHSLAREKRAREILDIIDQLENSETDQEDEDMVSGAPEYRSLITIHAGKPKGHMKHELKISNDIVRRLSVSEQALEKAATSYGREIVRFTQKNLIRVYPKGTRVDSSNYKPHISWMHGAQMVAFNMQGYGKQLWLMHGMFKANGNCGYVKKPNFLMQRGPFDEVFNPKISLPVQKILKVRVYMGDGWRTDFSPTHFDMFSPPDFYTKVHMVGVPADNCKKKTRIIEDDWVPFWDEEFEFPLTVPELALLRIEVREYDRSEKDDFGGQTCFPVTELRTGIRAVPLCDKKGKKYSSVKLLMRFQFVSPS